MCFQNFGYAMHTFSGKFFILRQNTISTPPTKDAYLE